MIENLVFGRSGLNSSVFEKLFILYSCILFIKHCSLKSFCIKMICFSKIWFFQIFYRLNLLLDQSKLWLKIWFESAWLDRCSIDAVLIKCDFRSIKLIFWTIENRSENFLKHEILTCSSLFQKFLKRLFSLSSTDPDSTSIFCHFPSNFLLGFCLLAPVRPFYPFLFCLISFFMHFREFFGPIGFWDFLFLGCFLS